ncbi:hypothetical protein Pmani_008442 [Petrolisthes manimaculis]|uniref:Uncharacterized protein n=1 Tax=Petrolisthes manimaculis TaxID=1843537 RepID=A0AAE1NUK6_9EUCA|nr:hypothetical protein Pmani_031696 [Petrolisthes manimaculis]KAK4320728.1 hypothetical protein Pmani_008434 [Petrolisthes manimaculis]KAK4320736.1 hypothetical protein Pmani_008442 [Petrolisthes manimaculis]
MHTLRVPYHTRNHENWEEDDLQPNSSTDEIQPSSFTTAITDNINTNSSTSQDNTKINPLSTHHSTTSNYRCRRSHAGASGTKVSTENSAIQLHFPRDSCRSLSKDSVKKLQPSSSILQETVTLTKADLKDLLQNFALALAGLINTSIDKEKLTQMCDTVQ